MAADIKSPAPFSPVDASRVENHDEDELASSFTGFAIVPSPRGGFSKLTVTSSTSLSPGITRRGEPLSPTDSFKIQFSSPVSEPFLTIGSPPSNGISSYQRDDGPDPLDLKLETDYSMEGWGPTNETYENTQDESFPRPWSHHGKRPVSSRSVSSS
jgi:hypothetical protein